MDLAVTKGCDAVDPDNVDGYTNAPGFPLTAATQLDYDTFLATSAHARGLAVGLKNNLDQVRSLVSSFDFAINDGASSIRSATCSSRSSAPASRCSRSSTRAPSARSARRRTPTTSTPSSRRSTSTPPAPPAADRPAYKSPLRQPSLNQDFAILNWRWLRHALGRGGATVASVGPSRSPAPSDRRSRRARRGCRRPRG